MVARTLCLSVFLAVFKISSAFQSCIFQSSTNAFLARVPSTAFSPIIVSPRDIAGSRVHRRHMGLVDPRPSFIGRKVTRLAAGDESGNEKDDDNNNDEENNNMSNQIAGRKKRVMIGYRISASIYAILGLSNLIPAIVHPEMAPIALNYSGGPILAAGVAYILTGAAENDRLGSDTYKRLNLMLSQFGFLWLLAAVLVRQTVPLTRGAKILSNPLVVLASLSALVNGIKGWAYGVKGWDKSADKTFQDDLVGLLKSTVNVVASPIGNIKAGFYLAATSFGGWLMLAKLLELVSMLSAIGSTAVSAAKFGSWALSYAKIVLLATAALTLADAAKRNRLEGTTFIELNVLSSFTWLGIGAFMLHSGHTIMASLATVFSSFSLFSGVSSYLKKREGK